MTKPIVGIGMLTAEEGEAMVERMVASKEYWIIPTFADSTDDFMCELEERFYGGEKNDDFEVMLGPIRIGSLRVAGCAFAHKKHCPPDELARFINRRGADTRISPEELESRDLLIVDEHD